MAKRPIDIAGRRFGKLVAIEPTGNKTVAGIKWRCKCDCGKEIEIVGSYLTKGNNKSCGCLPKGNPAWLKGEKRSGPKNKLTEKKPKGARTRVYKGELRYFKPIGDQGLREAEMYAANNYAKYGGG